MGQEKFIQERRVDFQAPKVLNRAAADIKDKFVAISKLA